MSARSLAIYPVIGRSRVVLGYKVLHAVWKEVSQAMEAAKEQIYRERHKYCGVFKVRSERRCKVTVSMAKSQEEKWRSRRHRSRRVDIIVLPALCR